MAETPAVHFAGCVATARLDAVQFSVATMPSLQSWKQRRVTCRIGNDSGRADRMAAQRVLGANDGIVSMVSLVAGVAASAAGKQDVLEPMRRLLYRCGDRERSGPAQNLMSRSIQADHVVPAAGDRQAVWRLPGTMAKLNGLVPSAPFMPVTLLMEYAWSGLALKKPWAV